MRRATGADALGGTMHLSIFGDTKLDLSRDPIMQNGAVTIVSLFGDAKVTVPGGARVRTSTFTIFGDSRVDVEAGDGPDVRITYLSLFGDLTVVEGKGVALPPIESGRAFPY